MENEKEIFDHNAIDFITVSVEFCKVLEKANILSRISFVDTIIKLLPLLYIKALLLPPYKIIGEEMPKTFVTENLYENLRSTIAKIMAEKDDYLDVFVSDMKYSDQPIVRYISEDLADIYQDIGNLIGAFQMEMPDIMNDALAVCQENFKEYWGQKLVNTLRALHEVKFLLSEEDDVIE